MSQKHHVRSASNGRKVLPTHARPSKPPPLTRRGHSYSSSLSQGYGPSVGSKFSASGSKETGAEVLQPDTEEVEMFLQFCTTCERQIASPSVSILYCSEACRKKDRSKPTPIQTAYSTPLTPSTPSTPSALPDIVPQRSPTMPRPLSVNFSGLTIPDWGCPTEGLTAPHNRRRDSEAARYLAQFHSKTWRGDVASRSRPQTHTASMTADSSALPSLIHSPSSSISTVASMASYNQRPLLSRHNKSYSAYSTPTINLVTPYPIMAPSSPTQLIKDSSLKSSTRTSTAFETVEAGTMSYSRRLSARRGSDATGTLKFLFSHDAIKAPSE